MKKDNLHVVDHFDISDEERIKSFLPGTDPQKIQLTDTIDAGCNNCGKCCINKNTPLTSLDIYHMRLSGLSKKEIIKNVNFYFGDNSHMPQAVLKNESSLCPMLKVKNGDFICKLGEHKPIMCDTQFIGIAMIANINKKAQKGIFTPLDQEVDVLGPEEFIEKTRIKNTSLYYVKDQYSCKAPKEMKTVEEYMKRRIDEEEEESIAHYIPELFATYVDSKEFLHLMMLSDMSKVNNISDKSTLKDSIMQFYSIVFNACFTFPEPDKPYKEQALKKIEDLTSVTLPAIRTLYKYLLKVFDADEDFKNILNGKEDFEKVSLLFDQYYMKKRTIISKNMIVYGTQMVEEMEKIMSINDEERKE